MIAERNPQLEKAIVKLRSLSADERARDLYERREKGRRDIASQNKYARLEGRLDVAKNLMKMGLPIEKIMEAANLTREEVEALRS